MTASATDFRGSGFVGDDEPWPGLVGGEPDVAVLLPRGAHAVVARRELVEIPRLEHFGAQRVGGGGVGQLLGLAQQRPDLAAVVAGEVAADALTKVGGLAHVEHLAAGVEKAVDAGRAGELLGERELACLRMCAHRRKCHQVVESQNPKPGRTLEQQVQQFGGGECIVECTVRGTVRQTEALRQRAESTIGHFVAHQSSGERQGVDDGVAERLASAATERGVDERHVESDVVAHDDGIADELLQGRQHGFDSRCRCDHGVGDAGEHRDGGRDGPPRVHQRRHRAELLSGAHLHHADLGDGIATPVGARGFDVEHAERDLVQRSAEVVDGCLGEQFGHPGSPARTPVRRQEHAFVR